MPMIDAATTPEILEGGFFPSLIPFKGKEINKFRYNHRLLIFEDQLEMRDELRTLFMRYNLTFEGHFSYEKLIEHMIKKDKIDLIIINKALLKEKNLLNTSINFLISVRIPFLYLDGPIEDHDKLYNKVLDLLGTTSNL